MRKSLPSEKYTGRSTPVHVESFAIARAIYYLFRER